ncbi:MAG: hypothetical protein ABSE79_21520 [Terriglobia bacterium]|jgi:hypothetical protein
MKDVAFAFLLIGLFTGCSKKPVPASAPDLQGWFIESYENGVITVQHEGNTYKATCDSTRFVNDGAYGGEQKQNYECDLAVELVGSNVQPFEGKQKDANGRIIKMWNSGSTLELRSWLDEHTPSSWREDEFKITSVTDKR